MRKEFEITHEQLVVLYEASKPVPYMKITGWQSAQDNANKAWAALGEELGFDYTTVKPVEGKDQHFFSAEVK